MARNGAGTYNRAVASYVNGTVIDEVAVNAEMDDIALALTGSIAKNGETVPTANLPMGTYRHTGVGNGTARTDYAAVGQTQDDTLNWVDGGGTADAITASYSPPITALVDGQLCCVRATAANTVTGPTFSPNGLTARTIVKNGGTALVVGDIASDGHELFLRYDLTNTRWELLNIKGQPLDATLTALAGLATGADKLAYSTGADTFAETALTPFARTVLDDANQKTALTTLGALGNALVAKTAAYTVVAADRGKMITCDGTWTLTLTAAATLGDGFSFAMKNIGGGVITINADGTELIDGNETMAINKRENTVVVCDGAAFRTVGRNDDASIVASKLSGNQAGLSPIFGVRAWVNFNGTGTVAINASGNVASITDNAVGDYTVNIDVGFSDLKFSVVGMCGRANSTRFLVSAPFNDAPTSGTIRLATIDAANVLTDVEYVNVTLIR